MSARATRRTRPRFAPEVTIVATTLLALLTSCGGRHVDVPGSAAAGYGSGCPAAGSGSAIVAFRAPNGSCVPTEQLLLYACVPDVLPPMIVRGGASPTGPRRFVGGRYAVEIDGLPPGVRPLGSAGDTQVLAAAADPARIFVRSSTGVERWLALPRDPIAAPPSVWFIGDSITLGAQPWIEESLSGWEMTFDAEIGRGSASGVSIAPIAASTLPDVVVIELGTNDADPAALATNATSILDALRDVPLVVWQNTHGPDTTIPPENNEVIRSTVAGSPSASVADWDRWVENDVLNVDGVHVQPAHEDEMAKLIVPFLVHWLAATELNGARACETDGAPL